MLGKVYSELLEHAPRGPMLSLRAGGASIPSILCYAMIPTMRGPLVGYTLYRWECAMRASAIVGLVGAGGLGTQILLSWRYQHYGELSILLLVLMALVCVTDAISSFLRRRWFHAPPTIRE
jgi:phosphonate transport system permease protein